MPFFSIPLRNLWRRPLRSSLTLLGAGAAVTAFVVLMGLANGVEGAWVKVLLERETHAFVANKGLVAVLTSSIDEGDGAPLQSAPGVRDVSGELIWWGSLDSGEPLMVTGWPDGSYLWQTLALAQGRVPEPGRTDQVVIGQHLAETLNLGLGSRLTLRKHDLHVVGITHPGASLRNNALILPLATLQAISNRPGVVTIFNLRLKNPTETDEVLARLRAAYTDFDFIEASAVGDQNQMLAFYRAVAKGISAMALFVALMVIANTLFMSVSERAREIAMLAAIGWSGRRILTMIALEGVILAGLGALLGALAGTLVLQGIADIPDLRGVIERRLSLDLYLEVAVTATLLGILASLIPGWRALRRWPAETLGRP